METTFETRMQAQVTFPVGQVVYCVESSASPGHWRFYLLYRGDLIEVTRTIAEFTGRRTANGIRGYGSAPTASDEYGRIVQHIAETLYGSKFALSPVPL